jgi:two-component system, OmpR family, response regulator CpxR
MYGSVEMLLKFYAENFHFRFTGQESREKPSPAHARFSFKLKLSHWRSRYFTRVSPNGRIHFALVESSSTILNFFAEQFFPRFLERSMKPKRTILCVDDNEQSLSIRKVMLETRGYRVLAYTDAQQALQRFAQGGVDLVLTDLIMPGIDGSKLIEGVKDISPETPAILLSGKVKIYERETGADVFLAKGMYAPVELLERIRLLLVRKRGPKRAHLRTHPQAPPRHIASA